MARFGRVTRWAFAWVRHQGRVTRVPAIVLAGLVLALAYCLLVPWYLLRCLAAVAAILGRNDVRAVRAVADGVRER